MQYLTLHD
jgi:hypothetical protein